METRQMIPFLSSTFSALTVSNIHFWIWKYSKLIFTWFWSILVCKILQLLVKSYRFGQLIILFLKVDTLWFLKIYIMFCYTPKLNTHFFRLQVNKNMYGVFFRTIFVILYNTIIFFVFGRFNLISCIKRPKQCELIRTLEGKKGSKICIQKLFHYNILFLYTI